MRSLHFCTVAHGCRTVAHMARLARSHVANPPHWPHSTRPQIRQTPLLTHIGAHFGRATCRASAHCRGGEYRHCCGCGLRYILAERQPLAASSRPEQITTAVYTVRALRLPALAPQRLSAEGSGRGLSLGEGSPIFMFKARLKVKYRVGGLRGSLTARN